MVRNLVKNNRKEVKYVKKAVSVLLTLVMMFSLISSITINSSAANYSAKYSSYSAPSNTSDYAYWNGSKVVRASGTSKSEVKWMQAAINYCIKNKGLNASYLDVDGSFGPASKTATKAFQKAAGLEQDGSFGPATIKKMKAVLNGTATLNNPKSAKYELVWPVKGTTTANISGKYGKDGGSTHYRPLGTTNQRIHSGIDISNGKTGSKILAVADGKVILKGYTNARGYYLVIYHEDIGISSLYEHLKKDSETVKVNDVVKVGQTIAELGNSGKYKNSSGKWVTYNAHLHFGLMNGKATSVDYDVWKVGGTTKTFSPDSRYNSNVTYTFK